MRKVLLVFLPLFSGCMATMEGHSNPSSAYAPVNEVNGGVVKYVNAGVQSVKEARREDAYRKMHDYCNGPYKIVQEGESMSGESAMVPIGGMWFNSQTPEWKIKFECVH